MVMLFTLAMITIICHSKICRTMLIQFDFDSNAATFRTIVSMKISSIRKKSNATIRLSNLEYWEICNKTCFTAFNMLVFIPAWLSHAHVLSCEKQNTCAFTPCAKELCMTTITAAKLLKVFSFEPQTAFSLRGQVQLLITTTPFSGK